MLSSCIRTQRCALGYRVMPRWGKGREPRILSRDAAKLDSPGRSPTLIITRRLRRAHLLAALASPDLERLALGVEVPQVDLDPLTRGQNTLGRTGFFRNKHAHPDPAGLTRSDSMRLYDEQSTTVVAGVGMLRQIGFQP